MIEATEWEIERLQLRRGDPVLTEGGDPDKLGRGALWGSEIAECIHQNHVFRVRIDGRRIIPVYANWLVGAIVGSVTSCEQPNKRRGSQRSTLRS